MQDINAQCETPIQALVSTREGRILLSLALQVDPKLLASIISTLTGNDDLMAMQRGEQTRSGESSTRISGEQ